MKKLFTLLSFLLVSLGLNAQVGPAASVRRELTPLQYNFGPFTAVANGTSADGEAVTSITLTPQYAGNLVAGQVTLYGV
jgi:hypothetical protein